MKIVSGLRRSGTSLMMHAIQQAGLKIAGEDFEDNSIIDGNPNGYWEIPEITIKKGLTEETKNLIASGEVIKVMFECLFLSDPSLIDEVVVTIREPKDIIASFLIHNYIKHIDLLILNFCLDVIDSIEFLENNNKKYIVVSYEDVLENPQEEMKKVCDFIGGDYLKASSVVDKKLNREKGKKYPHIKYLQLLFKYLKCGKIKEMKELRKDIEDISHKKLSKLN